MAKLMATVRATEGSAGKLSEATLDYEVLAPIKKGDKFEAPENIDSYAAGFAFKEKIEQGHTILVNDKGGWCYLEKDYQIEKMWMQ